MSSCLTAVSLTRELVSHRCVGVLFDKGYPPAAAAAGAFANVSLTMGALYPDGGGVGPEPTHRRGHIYIYIYICIDILSPA